MCECYDSIYASDMEYFQLSRTHTMPVPLVCALNSGLKIVVWFVLFCFVLFVFIEPNLFLLIIDFIRIIIRIEEFLRFAHGKLGLEVNGSR